VRYDSIYEGFARALNGLPPDIAAIAYEQLIRRKIMPDDRAYRLPLVTADQFDALAGAPGSNAELSFAFPTLGVIFGISRRIVGFAGTEDISDLDFNMRDASSNRSLIGTTQIPYNLSGIPDPDQGSSPYMRLSPVTCSNTVDWVGQVSVRAGVAPVVGPIRGSINLYGVGFWVGGEQISDN
jgi:hypothetical protein